MSIPIVEAGRSEFIFLKQVQIDKAKSTSFDEIDKAPKEKKNRYFLTKENFIISSF